MKTWTVVIEITDIGISGVPQYNQNEIEYAVTRGLVSRFTEDSVLKFRVIETIPAPYGPQKPGGVFISESKVKP